MRRNDREITDKNKMLQIMEKCDVCRLALHDEEYPYILPLNFGIKTDGEKITLYFHGADEGYKYELLARDNRVSFEMDCRHRIVSDREKGHCTMEYESVIGCGRLEIVPDSEKMEALTVMTDHYHKEHFSFNPSAVPRTVAMKLTVEKMTGKRRIKKQQ